MDIHIVLNRVSPVPLYHQLATQLRDGIASGAVAKGSFLGNELALAAQWGVSRPTVRRAIQELVDDGLLVRKRGIGTQVVSGSVRRPVSLSSLYEDLNQAGRSPATDVLSCGVVSADDDVAESLGVNHGDEVVAIVRRRLAEGRPLALMRNWLSVEVAGSLDAAQLTGRGLYELLRERGVRPHSACQRLGAKAATAEEAEALGLRPGAPLFTVRTETQDDEGRPVELGLMAYDADQYSVEMYVVEG